jgi:hypothetical protein
MKNENLLPESDRNSTISVCATIGNRQGALKGYRMSIDWNRFRSFVYGTWEPEVLGAVTATVKPCMTVIDIGAHIGYYTLLFVKFVGPNGRVVAFEPRLPSLALSAQYATASQIPAPAQNSPVYAIRMR